MKVIYLLIFILSCNILLASQGYCIKGRFDNVCIQTSVKLISYNYGEIILAEKRIGNSGDISFVLPENSKDGIYRLEINCENSNNFLKVTYFELIIDRKELGVVFQFDPTISEYPIIVNSEINQDWYVFLKLSRFRLDVIDYLRKSEDAYLKSETQATKVNLSNILKNELDELESIKQEYLKRNFNKWSTSFARNNLELLLNSTSIITKENYWSYFEVSNSDLINTPIFQDIIQQYIILYFNKVGEIGYKEGFEKVIEIFSENKDTKKWVIKYVMVGLKELGNYNLLNFFSKKYNYY